MKTSKIKKNNLKGKLTRLPRTLGKWAFLTFLGFLAIALILGGLVFFQYGFLAQKKEPQVEERPAQFKEQTYEAVLKIWQEREKRFLETDLQTYPDPFRVIASGPEK